MFRVQHGKGCRVRNFVHKARLYIGVGSATRDPRPEGDPCPKRCAYALLRKGHMSKPRMAYQEQLDIIDEWNPITLRGNPVSSALVNFNLRLAREEQRQVGVTAKQAAILMYAPTSSANIVHEKDR